MRKELHEHLVLGQVVEQLLARRQARQGGAARVAIGVVQAGDLHVTESAAVLAAPIADSHLRRIEPVASPVAHGAILRANREGLEHAGKRPRLRVSLRVRSDLQVGRSQEH